MVQTQVKPIGVKPFREILTNGTLRVNFHSGQARTWVSKKQIIAMLAGSQGGKTDFIPHWLDREIRTRGPGDYILGTTTYPLLNLALLPRFLYVFKDLFHYGDYNEQKKLFTFWRKKTKHDKNDVVLFPDSEITTRVIVGSAQNPESLESATVLGVALDECGMVSFKRETWEAIRRRTLINKARILMCTTLYGLGWLKTDIYDEWLKGNPDIDVIQFDSTANPAFPIDEFQRMQKIMPNWKFDMFHRGRFAKPAGLIYDAFDTPNYLMEPFEIPANWPRYVGHDFGPINTVALWKAYDPQTSTIYTYRDYVRGQLSTFEHVTNWIELSKGERIVSRMGGSPTEDGWRGDFTQAGWRIDKPLEGGKWSQINRVYGFEKLHKHKVFRTCQNYLSEKQTFSRKFDKNHEPIENEIEDEAVFHFMACLVGDTMIRTDKGLKPIKDVQVGDKVLTRSGYYPVKDKIQKQADVLEAKFSNGQILLGTPEHQVFVKDRGFIPLTSLRYNDTTEPAQENAARFINVTPKGNEIVYDLNVDTVHEYFANGILVHNSERYLMTQFKPLSVFPGNEEVAPSVRIKG